jgi:hypothetical protein
MSVNNQLNLGVTPLPNTQGGTGSNLTAVNSATYVTTSAGVTEFSGVMTNGQVIVGSTGATPTAATITAGAGISVTNGAASITIASTGGVGAWSGIAGTTQTAAVNSGYVIQNASATTVTLPTTAALGSIVQVQGLGAGGWVLAAGAGQTIQLGASATSTAGSLTSANRYDVVEVVCIVANLTWSVSFALSSGLTVA